MYPAAFQSARRQTNSFQVKPNIYTNTNIKPRGRVHFVSSWLARISEMFLLILLVLMVDVDGTAVLTTDAGSRLL